MKKAERIAKKAGRGFTIHHLKPGKEKSLCGRYNVYMSDKIDQVTCGFCLLRLKKISYDETSK